MKYYKSVNFLHKQLLRHILFRFDSEFIHEKTLKLLSYFNDKKFVLKVIEHISDNKKFDIKLGELHFSNPIGLAAGFDKNGVAIRSLASLGFGFLEIGTITPKEQLGNEKPRLFRLEKDLAIINRMGFNNFGSEKIYKNILEQKKVINLPLGINIGKNKLTPIENATSDYVYNIQTFNNIADYFTINISSPNTQDLRKLQEKNKLDNLLKTVTKLTTKPIFLKIDPDLSDYQLDSIVDVCLENNIFGIIATNTTVSRNGLKTQNLIHEIGGLSGRPLFEMSLRSVKNIYKKSDGKLIIIGVGGISTFEDAYKMVTSGASLIQVYTGMIYNGPFIASEISDQFMKLCIMRNISWQSLVGSCC